MSAAPVQTTTALSAEVSIQVGIYTSETDRSPELNDVIRSVGCRVAFDHHAEPDVMKALTDVAPDLLIIRAPREHARARIGFGGRVGAEFGVPALYTIDRDHLPLLHEAHPTTTYGFLVNPFEAVQASVTLRLAIARLSADRALAVRRAAQLRNSGLFSPRQLEALEAVLAHGNTEGAAAALSISPHTVRNHVKAVYRKLNVHSRTELLSRLRAQ